MRFLKNSMILDITFLKGCFPKMRRKTCSCFPSLAFSAVLFIRSDNGALDSTFSMAFSAFFNASCVPFCVPVVMSLMSFSAVV